MNGRGRWMLHRHFLFFVTVVPLLAGCSSHPSAEVAVTYPDGGTGWVSSSKLNVGPIQHAVLTEQQTARIAALQRTFAEVDGSSLEKWLDDFKHDANVDRELSVYEEIARAYTSYIRANRTMSQAAKREVYSLLLMRSGTTEEQTLARARLRVLDEKQARDVQRALMSPTHISHDLPHTHLTRFTSQQSCEICLGLTFSTPL
jgi:hypothetical protein